MHNAGFDPKNISKNLARLFSSLILNCILFLIKYE